MARTTSSKKTVAKRRFGVTYGHEYIQTERTVMKIRDVINLIEEDGWYLVTTKGSHRQYKHPTKPGRVTIAGHPNDDLAPGTLNSVFKQAQIQKPKKKKENR